MEPHIERQIGEHMAIRYLLGDVVHRLCRAQPNPAAYAKEWRDGSLAGLDSVLDGNRFSHVALHEVETFWENALRAFPGHSDTQPTKDGG